MLVMEKLRSNIPSKATRKKLKKAPITNFCFNAAKLRTGNKGDESLMLRSIGQSWKSIIYQSILLGDK